MLPLFRLWSSVWVMSKIESVSYIAFHNLDGLDGLDSGVGAFTIVGMRHMHVVGRLALMVVRMPRTRGRSSH